MKRDADDFTPNECIICSNEMTASGEHRAVSLKCGHLFGKSCVIEWINRPGSKWCPNCKKNCRKGDLRDVYLPSAVMLDAEDRDRLQSQLDDAQRRAQELELKVSLLESQNKKLRTEVTRFFVDAEDGEMSSPPMSQSLSPPPPQLYRSRPPSLSSSSSSSSVLSSSGGGGSGGGIFFSPPSLSSLSGLILRPYCTTPLQGGRSLCPVPSASCVLFSHGKNIHRVSLCESLSSNNNNNSNHNAKIVSPQSPSVSPSVSSSSHSEHIRQISVNQHKNTNLLDPHCISITWAQQRSLEVWSFKNFGNRLLTWIYAPGKLPGAAVWDPGSEWRFFVSVGTEVRLYDLRRAMENSPVGVWGTPWKHQVHSIVASSNAGGEISPSTSVCAASLGGLATFNVQAGNDDVHDIRPMQCIMSAPVYTVARDGDVFGVSLRTSDEITHHSVCKWKSQNQNQNQDNAPPMFDVLWRESIPSANSILSRSSLQKPWVTIADEASNSIHLVNYESPARQRKTLSLNGPMFDSNMFMCEGKWFFATATATTASVFQMCDENEKK